MNATKLNEVQNLLNFGRPNENETCSQNILNINSKCLSNINTISVYSLISLAF